MDTGLIGLALGSGMLAAVNPCGFALLPAYLSLLVLRGEEASRARSVRRALVATASMTAGFVAVFAVFGLLLGPASSEIQQQLPKLTVAAGLALMLLGLWVLAGRTVALPRRRGRTGPAKPLSGSVWSMTGFGVGYALTSLTCTVAPFLAVVVVSFQADDPIEGLVLFVCYALGMGSIVGAAALAVALADDALLRRLRGAGRWVSRVSGALLALSGAYVAYYGVWELRVLADPDKVGDPVIDGAGSVQHLLAQAATAIGPGGWALVVLVIVVTAAIWRRSRRRAEVG